MDKHATHQEIAKRLKRAGGHLDKVIIMIDEKRPCLEVAQQLQAVEHAIKNAKQIYIKDHVDHCLEGTMLPKTKKGKSKLSEFQKITKYL
jgi:hypothetical protein NreA